MIPRSSLRILIRSTTRTVRSAKALLAAQKDINSKADTSQKEKERVGKAYNTAAAAYKSAHGKNRVFRVSGEVAA